MKLATPLLLAALAAGPSLAQEGDSTAGPPVVEAPDRFLGVALVRGTDVGGFGVRGEYYRPGTFGTFDGLEELIPSLMIGADFTYFFPQAVEDELSGSEYTVNFFSLNVNTRGNYLERKRLDAYWLLGANVFLVTVSNEEDEVLLAYSNSTNAGLNLGTGAEYTLSGVRAFGEAEYALSSISQLVLTAGLRLNM